MRLDYKSTSSNDARSNHVIQTAKLFAILSSAINSLSILYRRTGYFIGYIFLTSCWITLPSHQTDKLWMVHEILVSRNESKHACPWRLSPINSLSRYCLAPVSWRDRRTTLSLIYNSRERATMTSCEYVYPRYISTLDGEIYLT